MQTRMVAKRCPHVLLASLIMLSLSSLPVCQSQADTDDLYAQADWVDPTDMLNHDLSRRPTLKSKPEETSSTSDKASKDPGEGLKDDGSCSTATADSTRLQKELNTCNTKRLECKKTSDKCQRLLDAKPLCEEPFFKQFIRQFLGKIDKNADREMHYKLIAQLSPDEVTTLDKFANTEYSNIHDAHHVLSELLVSVETVDNYRPPTVLNTVMEFLEENIQILLQVVCAIALSLMSAFILVHYDWNIRRLFWRLLFVLFIASFGWNWWHLYKRELAKQYSVVIQGMPTECKPKDQLYFWEVISTSFSLRMNQCTKYHEQIMVDPLTAVPPTKALAFTVTTFLVEPLEHIGKAIGRTITVTLDELPIALWPVFFGMLMILLLFITFGALGMRLRVFPFLTLEPAYPPLQPAVAPAPAAGQPAVAAPAAAGRPAVAAPAAAGRPAVEAPAAGRQPAVEAPAAARQPANPTQRQVAGQGVMDVSQQPRKEIAVRPGPARPVENIADRGPCDEADGETVAARHQGGDGDGSRLMDGDGDGSRPVAGDGSCPLTDDGDGSLPDNREDGASLPQDDASPTESQASAEKPPDNSDGDGSRPQAGDGDGSPPLAGDGDDSRPLSGDGDGSRPLAGDGDGSRPLAGDGDRSRPLAGDGDGSRPLAGDGDGSRPLAGDGDGLKPVAGDGDGSQTVDGDGDGSRPLAGDASLPGNREGGASLLQDDASRTESQSQASAEKLLSVSTPDTEPPCEGTIYDPARHQWESVVIGQPVLTTVPDGHAINADDCDVPVAATADAHVPGTTALGDGPEQDQATGGDSPLCGEAACETLLNDAAAEVESQAMAPVETIGSVNSGNSSGSEDSTGFIVIPSDTMSGVSAVDSVEERPM